MNAFMEALTDPDINFLRVALLMGLMSSVAFGMTGSLVVVKRISYVAGAISHAVLGGIGAALYFQRAHGIEWLHPLLGALLAALLAAVMISLIRNSGFAREDSVIGAVWAVGMATGLVFLARTPGYTDPMTYLFGNILILSPTDLVLVGLMDLVLLVVMVFGYNRLQAVCFDEEQARLRGLGVGFTYTLLLCLIAVTVVLLVSVVGVVLVVALLTIPAAMAGQYVRSLKAMMVFSSVLTFVFVTVGIVVGFLWDWPTGPAIILLAGAVYLLQSLFRRVTGYRR
ncbi:metal ABC transporter permease [Puniceicoccales bacterium CK1056]|uniref:Metal ABC transporter permease n=1 Tax=Oceanipulchritudo coccoides TaxID=2706888 RepID=A0A6B2M5V5_9BACT|nr:metal ABC transporter permease [Oceanipulchritudo coccoides]NDV63175.1 metal ABC transporter permease [Oceanipulchritudo coccoides]